MFIIIIIFLLQIHGLKRHKLDMGQILPSIGFRHSDGKGNYEMNDWCFF